MINLERLDEYTIGVMELDDQHRRMLDIINTSCNHRKPTGTLFPHVSQTQSHNPFKNDFPRITYVYKT
jgi:hypothetical protein